MGRYVLRRALQALLTLGLVMFLLHYLVTLSIQVNGNPARAFFGEKTPTEAQLAAVEERYNLADPCYDQVGNPCFGPFVQRMGNYAVGDFGQNLEGRPVTELVAVSAPHTMRLFVVLLVTWFVAGMFLGSVAARFHRRKRDYSIRFLSVLIDAFPIFVLLLTYKYVLAVPLNRFMSDTFGEESVPALLFKPSYSPEHPWLTLIVPGVLLGATGAAAFIRLVRASQLENSRADHVRTARAKGLQDGRVTVFHIVRNSSIPVATAIGFQFATALSGAVVTEGLMNIHGMGGLVWDSVRESDMQVVVGAVSLIAMMILVVNLMVDLVYAVLDPRIRYD